MRAGDGCCAPIRCVRGGTHLRNTGGRQSVVPSTQLQVPDSEQQPDDVTAVFTQDESEVLSCRTLSSVISLLDHVSCLRDGKEQ